MRDEIKVILSGSSAGKKSCSLAVDTAEELIRDQHFAGRQSWIFAAETKTA
ncbi:hypothetical protein SP21_36 [Salmonella phage 21]|nr:hypothetical protein SP21_36 [Salmonella phage 21]